MSTSDWVQVIGTLVALGVGAAAFAQARAANVSSRQANEIARVSAWREMIVGLVGEELDSLVRDRTLVHALCAPPPKSEVSKSIEELLTVRAAAGHRLQKLALFEVAGANLQPARAALERVWDSALDTGLTMKPEVRDELLARYKVAADAYVVALREITQKI